MLVLTLSTVVAAASLSPQQGLDTAVAACEAWILKPQTWADNVSKFPKRSGFEGKLEPQASIPDAVLPPPELRKAMHTWRVPIGEGGIFLTVSDQIPFCHIAGGGPDDFEPGAEAALQALIASKRWSKINDNRMDDLISTQLVSGASKQLTMVVTRAAAPGGPTDRVQVLATAQYDLGN